MPTINRGKIGGKVEKIMNEDEFIEGEIKFMFKIGTLEGRTRGGDRGKRKNYVHCLFFF